MNQVKHQTEIASYIGRLLRDNFGKGPDSVYVSIGHPFIVVYIRNLMSPTERVLMAQQQETLLQITRDTVMQTLIPDIKASIRHVAGMEVKEFYYDWNLHNKSAVFVLTCIDLNVVAESVSVDYPHKKELHQEISNLSIQSEKPPVEILSYLINPRTLVVIRNGILVAIEKQLIRLGQEEQLRIAKRALEKSLLHNNHFESVLNSKITDSFVDWDFELDRSLIIFILTPGDA